MAEGTEIIGSVSSATRSPGRYTFKWDMKDQQGKPVKPGTYTVCIEAAREHGTYQIMRQAMDFSGAAKQVDVPDQRHRDHRRVARLPPDAARSNARLEAPSREVLAMAAHLRAR